MTMTEETIDAEFDHEGLTVVQDRASGLRAVIAVHSTALGPAVGGLRWRRYPTLTAGIVDALRLSHAMTWKNAAAELPFGGGKAVVLDDGDQTRREARLRAFAEALNGLGGRYITAEDVGTSVPDMDLLASSSPFVAGISHERGGRGDPSPTTAKTVVVAIEQGVHAKLGADLEGRRVAVIGLGKVGARVAAELRARGAQLLLSDIDEVRARALAADLGGVPVDVEQALRAHVDVLAPCATGEMIGLGLVPQLSCAVVAGAANNPLVDDATADALHQRGILYVPDYLANCGGMLQIAAEHHGDSDAVLAAAVRRAAARIAEVLAEASAERRAPYLVARERVLARLASAGGVSEPASGRAEAPASAPVGS